MDPSVVAPEVAPELGRMLARYQIPGGEFPPASDDFLAEGGGVNPQYPSPAPGIFRYRTNPPFAYVKRGPNDVIRALSADMLNNKQPSSIEVTVFGQSYLNAQLKLVRVTDGRDAFRSDHHVLGTFRNSILRAVFIPPGGGGTLWANGEEYQVTVVNLGGTRPADTKVANSKLVIQP
jgi:hypothetical protein